MVVKAQLKDPDEYYDRKQKKADEGFCSSCGAVIKKEAEICPKCGVRNKVAGDKNKPKGKAVWLILWIILFWPVAIYYGLSRKWGDEK